MMVQNKEWKPSHPTIAEMFGTYRFADYKKEVIELLKKVCTVSVETVKVVSRMDPFGRGDGEVKERILGSLVGY